MIEDWRFMVHQRRASAGDRSTRSAGAAGATEAAPTAEPRELPGLAWNTDTDLRLTVGRGDPGGSAESLRHAAARRMALSEALGVGAAAPVLGIHRRALGGHAGACEQQIGGHCWRIWVEPMRSGGRITGCSAVAVDLVDPRGDDPEPMVLEQQFGATGEGAAVHEQMAAREHLAATGTLAAGLGHDISNILLPMRLRLDSIDRLELPVAARDDLRAIRHSMDFLRQLCNTLRHLVIDPEDPDNATGDVELAEWWDRAGPLLATALPRQVILQSSFPLELSHVAIAPYRLTQAVLNLLINAGEVLPEQGRVRVEAAPADQEGFVRISVIDNGPGMSPLVRRRSMQPFFTTKIRGMSTGLGLYLVQGIVKAAGGTVQIHTAPGEGTTVSLILPAVSESRGESGEAAAPLCATISLSDRRLAAYAGALLSSSGFDVEYDGHAAPAGPLWLIEANRQIYEIADRWLAADERRRLIAYGEAAPPWTELPSGAQLVDPARGLDALRAALRTAARELKGIF